MFFVDGEWLDHGDPRVDTLWLNRLTGVAPQDAERTIKVCEALVPDHEYIEAAASYPEDSYGCMAARMAYGTPVTRRNMQDLERGG